ncbi:PREDICTED: DNA-directed RNA polymerase I subunit RPA43 [Ficedula albicollis]|uniref:DNA-directed RNA polymerase I subunit RPA43 n=1 Tax=Ficedula albicollis TaxID=59894 RepID=UPI0003595ACC|nr:PREDICTED: DNA-directed RNA polymerase I subunit RPA43 [Ficedula albicollis]
MFEPRPDLVGACSHCCWSASQGARACSDWHPSTAGHRNSSPVQGDTRRVGAPGLGLAGGSAAGLPVGLPAGRAERRGFDPRAGLDDPSRSEHSVIPRSLLAAHRRHVALPPRFLGRKRSGIRAQLDAELLRYSQSLQGVPVAYDNIKVVGELGDIYDDQGFIHLNIEADFVIFSPRKGKKLVGVINKVAPSHIGCLIHGCFNASIPKPEHMSIVQWQELGFKIGDELKFQVLHLDFDTAGVFFIRGGLTKSSMRPKKSVTVTESTNGDEIQKLEQQENGLNDSEEDNVTEEPLNETGNLERENEQEPSVDAVNGVCDDEKKKKKKKKKDRQGEQELVLPTEEQELVLPTGEQELVLPTSDSSGYQSDHKKSKKKKRKHCDEVEESELPQLSEEPKAKKKRTKV